MPSITLPCSSYSDFTTDCDFTLTTTPDLTRLKIAVALQHLHSIISMCFTCGGMWPWGHAVHVADAPTKDEYIFLDKNHSFYKDHRKVSQPPVFCRTCPTASSSKPVESSSSLPAQFHAFIIPDTTHNQHCHLILILTFLFQDASYVLQVRRSTPFYPQYARSTASV